MLPALLAHLQELQRTTGTYHCDFLQWHSKGVLPGMTPDGRTASSSSSSPSPAAATATALPVGAGNNKCNTLNDIDIADYIAATFPEIAAVIPMGNEEADVIGGWSKVLPVEVLPWQPIICSRTLMGVGGVGAPHQCSLVAAACYFYLC